MNDVLKDNNTYILINKNPLMKINSELKNIFESSVTKGFTSQILMNSLLNKDPILPRVYGVSKIHKDNCPYGIIISSIDSPLYKFASS